MIAHDKALRRSVSADALPSSFARLSLLGRTLGVCDMVQDGEGKMLVIAVGLNTYQETLLSDKKKDTGPSPPAPSLLSEWVDR